MFNHHSLNPWGSFQGRQEEKWGSFWGRDHFGVGIISGSGSFRGQDHFGGCTALAIDHRDVCVFKDQARIILQYDMHQTIFLKRSSKNIKKAT